jgi:type II secretory pathway pseudopilin PulG
MNMNTLAALVLILAAPAGAQEYRQQQARAAEEAYGTLQQQADQMSGSAGRYVAPRVLDATIDAMNMKPAGSRVMSFLNDNKIDPYLATQAEPVKRGVVNGRAAILLSDALPVRPSVYAALIAAEAAKLMYADMPDGPERSYMRMATAARAYAEMGGEFKTLPMIGEDKVIAVQSAVGSWADPNTVAALDAGNARFAEFLSDESAARRDALQR